MATTRLQDDLLREFREEKKMIQSQIELCKPMALSLRKPAAQRLTNKGLIIFAELLCWIGFLGTIAFGIFLNKLYPFYLLFRLSVREYADRLGAAHVHNLQYAIYGLIGVVAMLFFLLAMALGRVRKKNDILSLSGKHIKTLMGEQLSRKAAIDAIEQRHFMELPQEKIHIDANDIPNPGYEPIK